MLKLFSSASGRRRIQSCSGWTLVEMMVAVAAGAIILGSFLVTTLTVSNTMLAVGNYTDLDKSSRNTLDTLSRDIRNAATVDNASTATFLNLTNTYHTYNNNTTNIIRYAWDGTSLVTRSFTTNGVNGVITTTTMLKNCDSFSFAYYQRNPTNNFTFVTTTNAAQIKLVSVSWRCSRQILGSKLNTESVQTAKVVVRN